MKLPYKVGKKVAVFSFDFDKNKDILVAGKIIARKWHWDNWKGELNLYAVYAIRFADGSQKTYKHEDIWTKWIEEEE